jgi:hypothetical protein
VHGLDETPWGGGAVQSVPFLARLALMAYVAAAGASAPREDLQRGDSLRR